MPGTSVPPVAEAPVADEVVPRLHIRDPDAWLRLVVWMVVGLCALQILAFSFGRDQGIYALVGEGLLHGQLPYRDLWDFKPPGIFFVYASGPARGLDRISPPYVNPRSSPLDGAIALDALASVARANEDAFGDH